MLTGWERQQKSRMLGESTIRSRLVLLRRFADFAVSVVGTPADVEDRSPVRLHTPRQIPLSAPVSPLILTGLDEWRPRNHQLRDWLRPSRSVVLPMSSQGASPWTGRLTRNEDGAGRA